MDVITTWEIIASLAGGAVCLKFFPELTWKPALLSFIAGTSCALFLTPLILWMLKMQECPMDVKCGVRFMTGIFGQLGLTLFQTKFKEGTWLKVTRLPEKDKQ